MTPALLTRVGEALYGSRWQSDLAAALDVSDRTVRRWNAGTQAIPDGLRHDLFRLIDDRSASLVDLVDALGGRDGRDAAARFAALPSSKGKETP